MKPLFCPLIILFSSFCLYGQKEEKIRINIRHELGIETTHLFSKLITKNDSTKNDSPYFFTYKMLLGNWAVRTGFGGDRNNTVEKTDGFADSKTSRIGNLDLRLGIEKRVVLGKRWNANLALDGIAFFSENKVIEDSGFDVITMGSNEDGWGIGPSIGLQFKVSDRFFLYTEGYAYFRKSTYQSGRTFQNFPEFDDEISILEKEEVKVSLPAVLYAIIQF